MANNIVRKTNFVRPSLSQLRDHVIATVNSRLAGADATLRNSVLNVLSVVIADLSNELYGYLDYIAQQVIIDTASDQYLDRWGLIWNITRKLANFATGNIIVTGAQGSELLAGREFVFNDIVFISQESIVILASGSATIAVKAKTTGINSNLPAGTVLTMSSPVQGVVSQATVGDLGITGGTARETDDAYLARILARIQQPPHGGSKTDWVNWTLSVAGVTRAWCYPLEMGPGTVGIRFMMDNSYPDGIPQAGDIQRVVDYLNTPEIKPVTADVYVNAPIAQVVDIEISGLSKDTPETRQAISAELIDLFARVAQPGGIIYTSQIWEAISIAAGVEHFALTSPSTNLQMPTSTIPILGNVIYTEFA